MTNLLNLESVQERPRFMDRVNAAVDRAIGVFSPATEARRQSQRMATAIQARWFHESADYGRSRRNWSIADAFGDNANLFELNTIRARSHDLIRNDGIAAGIIDTYEFQTIGTGLRAQARVDWESIGIPESRAVDINKQIDRAWNKWVDNVSVDNRLSFWELQKQVARLAWVSGEGFLVRRYKQRPGTPYSLCFAVVPPERVLTLDRFSGPHLRAGIEIGEDGEPTFYHVAKATPNTVFTDWRDATDIAKIPAFDRQGRPNVLHYFHQKEPDQTHGVPLLSPVMKIFNHLGGYMESEWVRARIAACFAAFIKKQADPGDMANLNAAAVVNNQRQEIIRPGLIQYLNEGEDVSFASPNIPGNQFEPFVIKALQFIGAALQLPIELVLKDWSRTNYSSARAALLDARRMFECEQQHLVENVCQKIRALFIDELVLRGELKVKNYEKFRHEYTRTKWVAPGWRWVDPLKEVQALVLAKNENITNLEQIYADQGEEWLPNLRQRAIERDVEDELNLLPANPTAQKPLDNSGEVTTKEPGDGQDKNKDGEPPAGN